MWESAKWYHWNARTQNTPDGIEIGIGGIFTDATNIAQALQLSDYHTRDPTTLNKLFWMINTNALDSHVLRKKVSSPRSDAITLSQHKWPASHETRIFLTSTIPRSLLLPKTLYRHKTGLIEIMADKFGFPTRPNPRVLVEEDEWYTQPVENYSPFHHL